MNVENTEKNTVIVVILFYLSQKYMDIIHINYSDAIMIQLFYIPLHMLFPQT